MTIQAMLKGVNRPVSLVPVYIGYENVMEVKSYLNELKGSKKKKESNLLRILLVLTESLIDRYKALDIKESFSIYLYSAFDKGNSFFSVFIFVDLHPQKKINQSKKVNFFSVFKYLILLI